MEWEVCVAHTGIGDSCATVEGRKRSIGVERPIVGETLHKIRIGKVWATESDKISIARVHGCLCGGLVVAAITNQFALVMCASLLEGERIPKLVEAKGKSIYHVNIGKFVFVEVLEHIGVQLAIFGGAL